MNSREIILSTCVAIFASPAVIANEFDLTWLEGHWCMEAGNSQIEEYWLSPAAGESVGIGRTLTGGKMTSFEYMRITGKGRAKVFTAQPGGSPATDFSATVSGKDRIVFENPQHDFPQRIEYRREGDALMANISGPGEGGEETTLGFEYRLCR